MPVSEFHDSIKPTEKCMRFSAVWPRSKRNVCSYLKFFVNLLLFINFCTIPQTTKLYSVKNNLNSALEILTLTLIFQYIVVGKQWNLWYNQDEFRNLLKLMEDDWKESEDAKRKKMLRNLGYFKFIQKFSLIGVVAMISLYSVVQLLNTSVEVPDPTGTSNTTRIPVYFLQSIFFFNAEASPNFQITWFMQCYATMWSAIAFVNYDGIFFITVLHLCAQLSILKMDIRNLVSMSGSQGFDLTIKPIIQRHQELKGFSQNVELVFNKVFLLQMVIYSLSLCLQGYQLVTLLREFDQSDLIMIGFIIIYITMNMFTLGIICFAAEKLRSESSEVFDEIYNTKWYELKPRDVKILMIVMINSQEPFTLTAGKFIILSMKYFMMVLKSAGGYLSMLMAVKNRYFT